MQAIVVREFGEPGVLQLEDAATPSPGPGQILVSVKAAGVNPVDTYIRSGTYAIRPSLPYTPGRDLSGTVEAVGQGVTALAPGDRVYSDGVGVTSGSYATHAVCEAEHVHPLPEQITFAQGAAIGVPYGTAWRAIFDRADAQAGEALLVHGASGSVGLAAVQIARAHGLTVIGTAGTPEGLTLVREQGAHHAVNHHEPDYLDAIRDATAGKGVDVVIEMLANVNLDRDLDMLAMGGRIIVIGSRGRIEIDPRGTMRCDGAILGMNLFNTPTEDLARVHAGISAGLQAGTLRPVVRRELPLGEAAAAHVAVMASGAHGKIVLLP
jgi:NADPH:quinone reductase